MIYNINSDCNLNYLKFGPKQNPKFKSRLLSNDWSGSMASTCHRSEQEVSFSCEQNPGKQKRKKSGTFEKAAD